MRNILHLRSSGDVLGAERVIVELGRLSDNYGFHSVIGAIHDVHDQQPRFVKLAEKHGLETATFRASRRYDPACIRSIRTYMAQNNIDLVHCHGYKEDVFGFFAARGYPRVATNHLWKNTTLRSKAYAALDAFLLRWFSAVIGVSDQIVSDMQKKGIRNPVKIANGIDCSQFRPKKKSARIVNQLHLNQKDPVICMVSSLSAVKGHTVALEALAAIRTAHPHVKLCIVGDGPAGQDIEKQIGERGLSRSVILMGSRADIPEILTVADIFLLPSFKEGLPMALLEAMAAGIAPIASKVGEIPQVIEDGISGILMEPGNSAQLAESLKKLLNDSFKRKIMGREARARVVNKFSSEAMSKAYCEVYDQILTNNRAENVLSNPSA